MIKLSQYSIAVGLLITVSFLLRAYNFNQHWGLGNDDARDSLIAREAIKRHQLPVMGSFSSAGPFAFGPLFYWLIILSYIIMPFTFVAPWILTIITSVLTVIIMIAVGYRIGNTRLAIIAGMLTATSPQLVIRSMSLGQHTYVAVSAALILLAFVLYLQTQQKKYALLLGLALGIAISMHYQSLNLILYPIAILCIPSITIKNKFNAILFTTLGFILPTIPYLYWEIGQSFANTRNLIDYMLIGQHRLYVPNSWKLFLSGSLPQFWSFVIGGYHWIAVITIIITAVTLLFDILKKKSPTSIITLTGIFTVMLLIIRYYKGERSEGYLIYFIPTVILLCGFVIYKLIFNSRNKIVKLSGITLITIIIGGNLNYYYRNYLTYQSPMSSFNNAIILLKQKYPASKFSVYDYQWQLSYHSQPLSFLLEQEGKIDKNGLAIGFIANKYSHPDYPIIAQINGQNLYNLSSISDISPSTGWVNLNQSSMYDDLFKWSKTEKLQSSFSFW